MSVPPVLSALSSRRIAALIRSAQRRVIHAAPGIQLEAAQALADRRSELAPVSLTVGFDFGEHMLRMGYGLLGTLKGYRPTTGRWKITPADLMAFARDHRDLL